MDGGRIPVNGPVAGHIIDGRYVEKQASEKRISMREIYLCCGICPFRRRGSLRFPEADVQPEGRGEPIRPCPSPSRLRRHQRLSDAGQIRVKPGVPHSSGM